MKEKQRHKPSKSVGGIYLIFAIKALGTHNLSGRQSHFSIYLPVFISKSCKLLSNVQGRAKQFLLSLVTHVPSGLMGFTLAA